MFVSFHCQDIHQIFIYVVVTCFFICLPLLLISNDVRFITSYAIRLPDFVERDGNISVSLFFVNLSTNLTSEMPVCLKLTKILMFSVCVLILVIFCTENMQRIHWGTFDE